MTPTKETRDQIDLPRTTLFWRKASGCWRTHGATETARRTLREITKLAGISPPKGSRVSLVATDLTIGAAPRSIEALNALLATGVRRVIDLRAERRQDDPLARAPVEVVHVPTFDDWRPKPPQFYARLWLAVESATPLHLAICCREGEHRAPLGGVVALVARGHSLMEATRTICAGHPGSELLPMYMDSFREYLRREHVA